jgi:hypothetical protein
MTHQPNWLERTLDLFSSRCMARQYRIARLLCDNTPQLFALQRLLSLSASHSSHDIEADVANGLWGYSAEGKWVIAPYYDECNDPKEELLQVRLGGYKHLLSLDGKLLFSVPATTRIRIKGENIIISDSMGERIIDPKKL